MRGKRWGIQPGKNSLQTLRDFVDIDDITTVLFWKSNERLVIDSGMDYEMCDQRQNTAAGLPTMA